MRTWALLERDVMALWLHYINGLDRMNTKTGPLNFIACRIRVPRYTRHEIEFMNMIRILELLIYEQMK